MENNNGTYCPILKLSLTAGEDIPAFRFVSYSGMLCEGDNYPIGVSETDWNSGDTMSVVSLGTAIVKASGSLSAGTPVTTSTDGLAAAASSDDPIYGVSTGAVSASGFATIKLIV